MVWIEDLPRREEIGHLRLLSPQELLFRLASEERDEILSADAKQLLAPFVPLRLRSHVNATLHALHATDGGVVAYVQKCSNLTRRVELVRPQFHSLFPGTLLEAAATWMGDQLVDVVADLVKIGLARRMSGHRPQTANLVWL